MNKKQNTLIIQMGIFFLIIILSLGLITIKEISPKMKLKKVDTKLNEYIDNNYNSVINDINIGDTKFQENTYSKKITNKKNNDLYFYIKYKNQKITSTYQKDYVEGKTLSNNITKYLNKNITPKINKDTLSIDKISISFNTKLNNCNDIIKESLLKKEYQMPLYTINITKKTPLTEHTINMELQNLDTYFKQNNILAKEYNLTFINNTNYTNTLNIIIKSDIIKENSPVISNAIINNNRTILNKYNVIIKYLN